MSAELEKAAKHLDAAMIWSETREGRNFWGGIAAKLYPGHWTTSDQYPPNPNVGPSAGVTSWGSMERAYNILAKYPEYRTAAQALKNKLRGHGQQLPTPTGEHGKMLLLTGGEHAEKLAP